MQETTIVFNSPGGWPVFLVLTALAALWLFWSYRRMPRTVSRRLQLVLTALRVLVVLVVLLLWLRPSMKTTWYEVKKPVLVLLSDTSRSMRELRDGPGGRSRAETVQWLYEKNEKLLDRLAGRYRLMRFQFARDIIQQPEPPREKLDASSYGEALQFVRQSTAGSGAAGVLVLGDGNNNFGETDPVSVAMALGAQDVPIHTIGIGDDRPSGDVRDVKIVEMRCPQTAYLLSEVPIEGRILVRGYRGKPVDVTLTFPGTEPQKTKVHVSSDSEIAAVKFTVVPKKEGEVRVSMRAEWLEGEVIDHNNVRSTYCTVVKAGLQVGYYDRLRPESKFIALALRRAQQLSASRVVWPPGALLRKELTPKWQLYDVIVLGDVRATTFEDSELQALVERVEKQGAGLLLLIGEQSGGRDGFAGTPLERALPVNLPAETMDWLQGPVKLTPPPSARHESILHISEDGEVLQAWKRLASLPGVYVGASAKRGGTVLLEYKDAPVLTTHQFGRGRVAVLSANTTFRWFFTDADTQELFMRFWRQLMMWVGGMEQRPKNRVWISIPRRRYDMGEKIPVEVHVLTEEGEPAPDAVLRLRMAPVDADEETTPRIIETTYDTRIGAFRGTIPASEPGDFQLTAAATLDEKPLGEDALKFVIERYDRELDDPVANHQLLRRLAAATDAAGGRFVPHQRFDSLLRELLEKGDRVEVPQTDVRDVWDRPWVFILLLALLVADWVTRRLSGLV